MAARKRKSNKKRSSRKKQGVSVLGLAETVMLLNVASQAAFKTDVFTFLTSAGESGSTVISARELLNPGRFYQMSAMDAITTNLKANWMSAAGMMIVIPLGFKVGKQLARPAISRTNRLLNKAGVGSTVKL